MTLNQIKTNLAEKVRNAIVESFDNPQNVNATYNVLRYAKQGYYRDLTTGLCPGCTLTETQIVQAAIAGKLATNG